jgi:ankyrin repeat protein
MNSFQEKLKVKAIKTALQALPKGLDAYDKAYDDAMTRIFSQDKDCQEVAGRALSLILCAKRPLKTRELQHALMIELEDTELDQDNWLEAGAILQVCAGLITIDESTATIRFVHYTTQEYLQRTQAKWLPRAENEIARTCLDYFSLRDFARAIHESVASGIESVPTKETFALAEYAVGDGPLHWNAVVEDDPSIRARLLLLLRGPETLSAVWVIIWSWRFSSHTGFGIVHWISQLGLASLAELCLANGFSSNVEDEDGCCPLSHAAQEGHEAVVRVLLARKADLHHQDCSNRTALSYAAAAGHEPVARLLLAHNAIVDTTSNDGATALSYAVRGNHHLVGQLLLEHNAAVDLATNKGWTPLSYAADGGHTSMVQLLVNHNAAIDSRTRSGLTPLHAASRGHESASRLLLERGADPNATCNQGRTPSSYAAGGGYVTILQLLLGEGADPNITDSNGRNPLYYAVKAGSIDAVATLCHAIGADIDLSGPSERSPLSYALERVDESVPSTCPPGRRNSHKERYHRIAQILTDTGKVNLAALAVNPSDYNMACSDPIIS